MRIFLARHGETDWNAQGKLQGHTDVALNEAGLAQAAALAQRLHGEGVDAVTTSDLSRARETGVIVARALEIPPPFIDGELRERCFGVFEGLTRDECASRHPDAWRGWLDRKATPEGAEPREESVARMTRALRRIAQGTPSPGLVSTVLVVSHGAIMRLWLESVLESSVPLIGNGTVYIVEPDDDEPDHFRVAHWPR